MSFADDIRKNYVEPPKKTLDSNYIHKIAKEVYDIKKKALEIEARCGNVKEVYVGSGIRKKKCIETIWRIYIDPRITTKELQFSVGTDDHKQLSTVYAYNPRSVKNFFYIIKEMAVKEGISMELRKDLHAAYCYLIYFRVFL